MRRFILLLIAVAVAVPLLLAIFGSLTGEKPKSPKIRVFLVEGNKTVTMNVEDYLVGVVAAEMPAKFEAEALKAQSIAARTYALKKISLSGQNINAAHNGADVCTNPAHCQGWISDEEMKKKWSSLGYWRYKAKIKNAVSETFGQVITYERKLIDPVYHSTCGGRTENSGDIWTYSAPYLKSIICRWDGDSPKYSAKTVISFNEIKSRLGVDLEALPASSGSGDIISVLERTSTGRAKVVKAGEKVWSATEFRRLLGLNSTDFSWEICPRGLEFRTTGYGHGVGMCQYGANGLAKEGKTAQEIIKYYYSGVRIEKLY